MRIVWMSNPAFGISGYSNQTKMFVDRLQKDGHDVIVVSNRGNPDGVAMTVDGIYHYPAGYPKMGYAQSGHPNWGWVGLLQATKRFKPDVIFSLYDIWTFPTYLGKYFDDLKIPWLPIVPIDSAPMKPATKRILESVKHPVAMSPYGYRVMKEMGMDCLYQPHGVDTSIFTPRFSNIQMRDVMGGNEKFIIGTVAANRSHGYDRKAFKQMLEAVGRFQAKYEDVAYYIHTVMDDLDGGYNLANIAEKLGVKFAAPDIWQMLEGFTAEQMSAIYNNFDVHLLPSRGEGFGIPLIEAQACGVPVITTQFAAAQDLCASGWLVNKGVSEMTDLLTYQMIPSVDNILEKLEYAYKFWKSGNMWKQKVKARNFALNFDIDLVYSKYMYRNLRTALAHRVELMKEKEPEKVEEKDNEQ
jgi:glycosyltransferase involved in cell wall biosynthesis